MNDDELETMLGIAAGFDWITPLYQWLAGYNNPHLVTDDYLTAALACDALRAQGIAATLFIGGSSYTVLTKAPVETVEMANNVSFAGLTIVKTESGPVRLLRWLAGKI